MENWTAGYVADIGYTFGYYHELNPNRIKFPFLNAGLVYPECTNVCELGFGQGVSINIHAATSNKYWYGTDFNPSQASFANDLAQHSESKVLLKDESFNEFCQREDLPDFDFIGMHGIWSWINDENRLVIVDFLKRKLKIGGVLYISYNTMPGWTSFAPIRHLLTEHASVMSSSGVGVVNRVDAAIEYVKELNKNKPLYLQTNALIEEKFKKLEAQSRQYLAHEYFNKDWHPMYFSSMAELLESAKLEYACSANYLEHVDKINLTDEQIIFLNGLTDQKFKETSRDFIVNQQFRRDYWVKGKRKLNNFEQLNSFRRQKIILIINPEDINLKVNGVLGEANMSDNIYKPIFDILGNHQPLTLLKIEEELKDKSIDIKQINQAIMILVGKNYVASVQDEEAINSSKRTTELLNYRLMQEAKVSNEINYLASPVTGGGIAVSRFHQLFLLALKEGKEKPEDWANFVWEVLTSQGQKIIKEGQIIESVEENKLELLSQANNFNLKHLHIMKALKLV